MSFLTIDRGDPLPDGVDGDKRLSDQQQRKQHRHRPKQPAARPVGGFGGSPRFYFLISSCFSKQNRITFCCSTSAISANRIMAS